MNPTHPDPIFGQYVPQGQANQQNQQMPMQGMQQPMNQMQGNMQHMPQQIRGMPPGMTGMNPMASMPGMSGMQSQMAVLNPAMQQLQHMQHMHQIQNQLTAQMAPSMMPNAQAQFAYQNSQRMMPQMQNQMPANGMGAGHMAGVQMSQGIPPNMMAPGMAQHMNGMPFSKQALSNYNAYMMQQQPMGQAIPTKRRHSKQQTNKIQQQTSLTQITQQPPPQPIPPPTVYSPPAAPTPPVTPMPNNDIQQIKEALDQLNEEKMDLFFMLFDCSKKSKNERYDRFIHSTVTKMSANNPNAPKFILYLLDQFINSTEVYQTLREPPIPIVFNKKKKGKPVFKLISVFPGFELSLPTKIRRDSDTYVIGTIYSPPAVNEPIQQCSVMIDKVEIMPASFGEASLYYLLMTPKKLSQRSLVQIRMPQVPTLAWFIVQFVSKNPAGEIVRDILTRNGYQHLIPPVPSTPVSIMAQTPLCKGCQIDMYNIIEQIFSNGNAVCPVCSSHVILQELKFDKRTPVSTPITPPQQPPSQVQTPIATPITVTPPHTPPVPSSVDRSTPTPPPSEDQEIKQGRLSLAEQMSSILKPKNRGCAPCMTLFNSEGFTGDVPEFNYYECINFINDMKGNISD